MFRGVSFFLRMGLAAMVFVQGAAASVLEGLDAAERAKVVAGQQVVRMEEMPGKPWPRIRIIQRVAATPEEVAAVFFDYRNAKSYVPKVIKSEISKTVSPCVLEVDYGIDVPLLPNELYTARNSLSRAGEGYRVDWVLLRALQTKSSEGSLLVEPFEGGSVLRYTNLVTPGSGMAVVLRIPAIDQMKSTVSAIVRQVERQKTQHPLELARQVAALRSALQAEGR